MPFKKLKKPTTYSTAQLDELLDFDHLSDEDDDVTDKEIMDPKVLEYLTERRHNTFIEKHFTQSFIKNLDNVMRMSLGWFFSNKY